MIYGSHFTVIQVYHLSVTTHKGFLLLLQILRIYTRAGIFFLFGQYE